jgi:hypothetical protein
MIAPGACRFLAGAFRVASCQAEVGVRGPWPEACALAVRCKEAAGSGCEHDAGSQAPIAANQ